MTSFSFLNLLLLFGVENYANRSHIVSSLLFLDEVFKKNKDLSKDFHSLQIELYLKFRKD